VTARPRLLEAGLVAGAAAASALFVLVAYVASPMIALALAVAAVGAAVVLTNPMAGIYAALLAVVAEPLNLTAGAVGLSAAEAVLLATAASVALHLVAGSVRRRVDPAHAAFGALVLVAATGAFFAVDVAIVGKIVLMWSVFLVLSVYVAGAEEHQVRRLAAAIVASCAALGLFAVLGAGDLQSREGGQGAEGRASGAFNHPNLLAQYLVLGLPLAIVAAVEARGRWRPVALAAAALIAIALLLTLTRAAIIGGAVGVLALMVWPRFRRAAAIGLCVVMAGLPLGLSAVTQSRDAQIIRTRLSTVGAETETNPRLRIYERAPSMLADRPLLGVGIGNFYVWSPLYGMRDKGGFVFEHAHNVALTIALETGLIGLAALVAFVWRMAAVCLRVVRQRAGPLHGIGVGVVAGFASIATVSLTDYPLRSNPVTAVLLLEVGLLLAVARLSAGRTSERGAGAPQGAGRRADHRAAAAHHPVALR
jgi:O-antigen ligase